MQHKSKFDVSFLQFNTKNLFYFAKIFYGSKIILVILMEKEMGEEIKFGTGGFRGVIGGTFTKENIQRI